MTLIEFATANGFANVAEMHAALGAEFVQTAYADARNAALVDTPAIPAPAPVVTWRDEVLAMFDGQQKDGTPFLRSDPAPVIVAGSDTHNGVVVGVDGANGNAVRVCRYETRTTGKTAGQRNRVRQQPVWTLDTVSALAEVAATLLGFEPGTLDAAEVLANVTEPTLAEQLNATDIRSEMLKIAKAHGVAKIPHASKMRSDTLRKRILAAADRA